VALWEPAGGAGWCRRSLIELLRMATPIRGPEPRSAARCPGTVLPRFNLVAVRLAVLALAFFYKIAWPTTPMSVVDPPRSIGLESRCDLAVGRSLPALEEKLVDNRQATPHDGFRKPWVPLTSFAVDAPPNASFGDLWPILATGACAGYTHALLLVE
jgi:hypothetical protein